MRFCGWCGNRQTHEKESLRMFFSMQTNLFKKRMIIKEKQTKKKGGGICEHLKTLASDVTRIVIIVFSLTGVGFRKNLNLQDPNSF